MPWKHAATCSGTYPGMLSSPFSGFLRTFQDGLGRTPLGRPPPHLQLLLAPSTLADNHLELPRRQHWLSDVLDAALRDRDDRRASSRASRNERETRHSRRMFLIVCSIIEGYQQNFWLPHSFRGFVFDSGFSFILQAFPLPSPHESSCKKIALLEGDRGAEV